MMTSPDATRALSQPAPSSALAETPQERQRRELRLAECAKRGVRFLPAQVMRPIYDREKLL